MSSRRGLIAPAFAGTVALCLVKTPAFAKPEHPDPKWHEAAVRMRQLAELWGDHSYGAVLVVDGAARAGVIRMYFSQPLQDAGVPLGRAQ
jgi:hypothetical protein